jgi:uncharacterized protein (TIGR02246 family)
MRRKMYPLIVLVGAACQQPGPGAVPLTDQDMAAIRSLGEAYAEANLAGDADAVAAIYAVDAVEMPPNEPATVGRDAIRARYASGMEAGGQAIEFTVTSAEIDGMNGLAYDRGTWAWTGIPPGMTEPITGSGKHLIIARRQEDGSWLWTVVIWNSDTPLPQPE